MIHASLIEKRVGEVSLIHKIGSAWMWVAIVVGTGIVIASHFLPTVKIAFGWTVIALMALALVVPWLWNRFRRRNE